MAHGSNYNS